MLDNNSQKNQTTDIINNTYPAASALQKFSEKNKKKKTKKKTGKYLLVKGTTQKNQINNFERKNCHHAKITTVRGETKSSNRIKTIRSVFIELLNLDIFNFRHNTTYCYSFQKLRQSTVSRKDKKEE
ncbi:conserved hypothetical protein [Trichinella spiralis]|uniref:hypothetical protein n=1 Tax=Trichinella spiralis TaxID=6334 RepID=UPI0001EFC186|nr:conserved hypothetical protein [Trichinella spiralis]